MKASADRKHMLIHLTLDADEDELVEGERRERRATTARKTTKEARAGDNECGMRRVSEPRKREGRGRGRHTSTARKITRKMARRGGVKGEQESDDTDLDDTDVCTCSCRTCGKHMMFRAHGTAADATNLGNLVDSAWKPSGYRT